MQDNLNSSYKTSRFSHLFRKENNFQLLHSIIMKPLTLDKEAYNIFKSFTDGANASDTIKKNPKSKNLVKHLISERFLVDKDINEVNVLRKWAKEKADIEGLLIMYVLPTDECNYRCKYCFIENSMDSDYKFSRMDKKTLRKGVDFFAQNAPKNKSINQEIIFYGGEPLMNPEIVLEGIKFARRNYPEIKVNIVTNGSLMTPEIAKIIAKNNIGASISLDGSEEINNKIRVFKNGLGSYDSSVKGYNMLKNAGCDEVGISFTLANHNVPNLKQNIEKICDDFEPTGLGFNFLVDTVKGKNPFSLPMKYVTEQAIEAFKFLREKGIYEDRMMRKIKPFIKGALHLKDCGAPGNQIVLAPNGDIGPCQGFLASRKYYTMNINESPDLQKDSSFNEWKDRYAINMDECLDCEALGICGGGCPYNSYVNKGSIWEVDERICDHNKTFLNWLLWDLHDLNDKS